MEVDSGLLAARYAAEPGGAVEEREGARAASAERGGVHFCTGTPLEELHMQFPKAFWENAPGALGCAIYVATKRDSLCGLFLLLAWSAISPPLVQSLSVMLCLVRVAASLALLAIATPLVLAWMATRLALTLTLLTLSLMHSLCKLLLVGTVFGTIVTMCDAWLAYGVYMRLRRLAVARAPGAAAQHTLRRITNPVFIICGWWLYTCEPFGPHEAMMAAVLVLSALSPHVHTRSKLLCRFLTVCFVFSCTGAEHVIAGLLLTIYSLKHPLFVGGLDMSQMSLTQELDSMLATGPAGASASAPAPPAPTAAASASAAAPPGPAAAASASAAAAPGPAAAASASAAAASGPAAAASAAAASRPIVGDDDDDASTCLTPEFVQRRLTIPGASQSTAAFRASFDKLIGYFGEGAFTNLKPEPQERRGNILMKTQDIAKRVSEFAPHWDDYMKRLAIAAIHLYRQRMIDVTLRDHVHLLWIMFGMEKMRAHNGSCYYLNELGQLEQFAGLLPESIFDETKEFMLHLEGLFLLIDPQTKREDGALLTAIDKVVRGDDQELMDDDADSLMQKVMCRMRDAAVFSPGLAKRGRKAGRRRGSVEGLREADDAAAGAAEEPVDEEPGDAGGADDVPWTVHTAKSITKLSAKMQGELLQSKLLSYFIEWCA